MLAAVNNWREEIRYVKNVLNRKKMMACVCACVCVCMFRFIVVFGIVITPPPDTWNTTTVNTTLRNISEAVHQEERAYMVWYMIFKYAF